MNTFFNTLVLFIYSFVHSHNETCSRIPLNNCVTFSLGQGTGCAWMCNYCATQLGTNNYYFTDNICTYKSGVGCVGSPAVGISYTCCSN